MYFLISVLFWVRWEPVQLLRVQNPYTENLPSSCVAPTQRAWKILKKKMFISTFHKNLAGLIACTSALFYMNTRPQWSSSLRPNWWKQRPAEIQYVCSAAKQGLCRAYGHMAMDSPGVLLHYPDLKSLHFVPRGLLCYGKPILLVCCLSLSFHFSCFLLDLISLVFSFVLCSLSSSIPSVSFPSLINVLLLFTIK